LLILERASIFLIKDPWDFEEAIVSFLGNLIISHFWSLG